MKRKPISISLAIVAITTSSLCFTEKVNAQMGEGTQGVGTTSTASHPGLRRQASAAQAAVKLSEKDRKFIQFAANTGLGQVADGKQAQAQGQSAEVKKIGANMVADYSKANSELQALAKKKGLGMDMGGGKPRSFPKATFDHQYLYNLEEDHKSNIKAFQQEVNSGDDAEVKAWAAKTLPTQKSHLAMIKEARKNVK